MIGSGKTIGNGMIFQTSETLHLEIESIYVQVENVHSSSTTEWIARLSWYYACWLSLLAMPDKIIWKHGHSSALISICNFENHFKIIVDFFSQQALKADPIPANTKTFREY